MDRFFYSLIGGMCIIIFFSTRAYAQEEENESKAKTGWTFGALPTISFDTDVGFQYGGLVNLYHYGDGSTYPQYRHSIYMEISRTTKGSGINRFYYDSEYLIPRVRLTADISYLTEQAMQFFGFNGAETVYNRAWEVDTDPEYKSRLYYRHDRKIFRIMPTFQGNLLKSGDKIRWVTGFAYYNNKIASVDIERLNKGKDEDKKLPDVDGLYDEYVNWGLITEAEKEGNVTTYVKGGLVYDTRDAEAHPFKGIWTEAVFSYAPGFLGDGNFEYTKFTLVHRQYFTVIPDIMSFAYRVGYQGTISGRVPFHMQPHIVPTFLTGATSQGLGGSKTLRGIQRNRVVGDGIVLGNVELRYKFFRTVLLNQNLYLATNLFFDTGMVVDSIELDKSNVPASVYGDYFSGDKEKLHNSAGIGLKVALNENFIVSFDYGKAFDKNDGNTGFYIALNFLY